MITNLEPLLESLKTHEGFRALVYDDKTGRALQPGDLLQGNPTIGYGWALNRLPMSKAQAGTHLRETVMEVAYNLQHRLPWLSDLDDVRQLVLCELAYNMGVDGLVGFVKMLDALRRRRYELAAAELLDSKWARDVGPVRVAVIVRRLATGDW